MVAERLAAERERPRVVGIAPGGRGSVRAGVRAREASHRLESFHVRPRHLQPEPAAQERRQEEQLGHEAVVRGGHLEVDAVGGHLARELGEQK